MFGWPWPCSMSLRMTTVIAAVDDADAVLATDGLMEYGGDPYCESTVKIMVLRDSLLVGFITNSLDSVRRIQAALAPGYVFDNPSEFSSAWNRGSRRVDYGYANAKARITRALKELIGSEGYVEDEAGCGAMLVGRASGKQRAVAWDTSCGTEPIREYDAGVLAIGSRPPDGTDEYEHFMELANGKKTTRGAERGLIAAIRYCAVDLKLPAINGNVATCRMSERGRIRWDFLPPSNTPAPDSP